MPRAELGRRLGAQQGPESEAARVVTGHCTPGSLRLGAVDVGADDCDVGVL